MGTQNLEQVVNATTMLSEKKNALEQYELDRVERRLPPPTRTENYMTPKERVTYTNPMYRTLRAIVRIGADLSETSVYGSSQGNDPDGMANPNNPHHDPDYLQAWYADRLTKNPPG